MTPRLRRFNDTQLDLTGCLYHRRSRGDLPNRLAIALVPAAHAAKLPAHATKTGRLTHCRSRGSRHNGLAVAGNNGLAPLTAYAARSPATRGPRERVVSRLVNLLARAAAHAAKCRRSWNGRLASFGGGGFTNVVGNPQGERKHPGWIAKKERARIGRRVRCAFERLDLTDAQKRDKRFYSEESIIILSRDAAGLKRGTQCRLLEISDRNLIVEGNGKIRRIPFTHLDRVSVCEPKELALTRETVCN